VCSSGTTGLSIAGMDPEKRMTCDGCGAEVPVDRGEVKLLRVPPGAVDCGRVTIYRGNDRVHCCADGTFSPGPD